MGVAQDMMTLRMALPDDARVLDVECGTGVLTRMLARHK